MCGIVGVVDYRSLIDRDVVLSMRDALSHRGPDDASSWFSASQTPQVALAHRRLAIIDLSSSARQPMVSQDGGAVLVFNGEIYNYRELIPELEDHGWRFRSESDSEVLLAAYQVWGTDCLSRLNGMWAFAIWDEKRRRLFAARDRLGKKPFYYYWDGRLLALASEMKALFRHPEIDCRPHDESLTAYCQGFVTDRRPQTMFEGIRQLPAAHQFTLDASGRFEKRCYWKIDPQNRVHCDSPEAYAEQFRALFEDSVRLRLRADVAVGSSLSGGLDSSLIVGTVAKLRGENPSAPAQHTFSARFPDTPVFDEGPFIDEVVARTDARPHRVTPDTDGLLSQLRRVHYHQEEPFQSSSIFAQWEVMRAARASNIIVLLDGQGADELLAGYVPYAATYLLDLLHHGRLPLAWREYRALRAHQAVLKRQHPHLAQRCFDLTPAMLLAGGLRKLRRRLRRGATPPPAQAPVSSPHRSRLWARLNADVTVNSLPTLLRYADRNAMAFGVEVRNPFLDYRLVEFAMGIPDELKLHNGWTKHILRAAGKGLLPESVRWRRDKVGYITPEDEWLRGPLRSWAQRVLFGPRLRELPGYPLRRVRRQWEQHQSGRKSMSKALWPWLSLHEWLALIETGAFTQAPAARRAA